RFDVSATLRSMARVIPASALGDCFEIASRPSVKGRGRKTKVSAVLPSRRRGRGLDSMTHNHLVRLKSRPRGVATRGNFTLAKEPIPPLRDGEIAIDTKFISLDPAMRGWMSEAKSYVPPVGLGDVMRANAAGHVVPLRTANFAEGDAVVGVFGVQSHPVVDGKLVLKVDTRQA